MHIVSAYSITTPRTGLTVDAKSRTSQFTVDVKNEQPVLDRVVLAIESAGARTSAADPKFLVDRNLRSIPPEGSEQYLVTVEAKTVPVGTHRFRPVAYSADRPPDDTKVNGPLMTLTIPKIPPPPPLPWWRRRWPWWLVAAGIVLAVAIAVTVVVIARSGSERPSAPTSSAAPTSPAAPTGPAATGSQMQPGQVLAPGHQITSASGRYQFIYQTDGNLVLYDDGRPIWASNTDGQPTGICIMKNDGNLVVYTPKGHAIWDSNTDGHNGSHLLIQDDGNAVIYDTNNHPVWATNTNGK